MNEAQFSERVADAFERAGMLDGGRRSEVERVMSERGLSFEMALYQVDAPSRTQLKQVLEEVTGTVCLDPALMHLTDSFVERALRMLDPLVLVASRAFPVQVEGNVLHVAMVNPTEGDVLRRFEGLSGMRVEPHVAPERGIVDVLELHCSDAIRALRGRASSDQVEVCDAAFEEAMAVDASEVIEPALRYFSRVAQEIETEGDAAFAPMASHPTNARLLTYVFNRLVLDGASDLHFEPQDTGLKIRPRIDGVLSCRWEWPRFAILPVIARLKVMSGLDPAPAEEPQDANIEYGVIYGKEVEFRVSILPALHGEKAVLRVLDRSKGKVAFTDLGFEEDVFEVAKRNFEAPTGLILVTGPTGSGKTTTLYSALDMVNHEGVNVVTAEDPVESKIRGTTQVHCTADGVTFAAALRSFLRQDPDIIMVGEIRDEETATIAMRAALTGHLVLSTLHTNDAASTIMRMTNMGLEPFLVGAALRMVIAQRLVRRLCEECRKPVPVDEPTALLFREQGLEAPEEVWEAAGCDRCNGTGYRGRTGLYEVLDIDEEMERLVVAEAAPTEIRAASREAGNRSLFADGLVKVADGRTSLAEIHRVTAED